MQIRPLQSEEQTLITEIVALLIRGFIYIPEHEKDVTILRDKIEFSCDDNNISLVALDEQNNLLGWIAGFSHYERRVWELHPLIIDPQYQRRGIGTQLVSAFEQEVRQRDGITIYLGADDRWHGTSLYGEDLYENLWDKIQCIKNINHHPFEFYQKCGYQITGVIPDANGLSKPDILMAKRVRPWTH